MCTPKADPPVIEVQPHNSGESYNTMWDPATGLLTSRIVPSSDRTSLMLSFTNTSRGCRDMVLVMPGFDPVEDAAAINPQYLSNIEMFSKSAGAATGEVWMRTMGLRATNGNPEEHWADRPLPSWPSFRWGVPVDPKGPPGSDCSNSSYRGTCFTGKPNKAHPLFGGGKVLAHGWPWEAVVDLANAAGVSLWINVPALATDDYIENLVRLVDERLHPDLNVMVEYSNEVWNVSP